MGRIRDQSQRLSKAGTLDCGLSNTKILKKHRISHLQINNKSKIINKYSNDRNKNKHGYSPECDLI
jgi:hypothetical protein